jgi:hypothetical protein
MEGVKGDNAEWPAKVLLKQEHKIAKPAIWDLPVISDALHTTPYGGAPHKES